MTTEKGDMPKWLYEVAIKRSYAHAFILHGSVNDLTPTRDRVPAYLSYKLASYKVVAFYDRAHGISFRDPESEQTARTVLEFTAQNAPKNELADLLGGGSSSGTEKEPDWPVSPTDALPLLEALMLKEKSAVIITYAEHVIPQQDIATMSPDDRATNIILRSWGTDSRIMAKGSAVFMLTELLQDLASTMLAASSGWQAVKVPMPTKEERKTFMELFSSAWNIPMDMSMDELANETGGLSLSLLDNIWIRGGQAGKITSDLVMTTKNDLIAAEYSDLVNIEKADYDLSAVGEMEWAKAWAQTDLILPVKEGRLGDVPKGIILTGPPGTGKSYFVSALSGELGFPLLSIHGDKILSKWQGESERRMAKVLALAENLAPVMLFMDEIDQSEVASRGQDSGSPSAKNLFNQLLQCLGKPENRGRIIFCAATNRPDLLDPALKRSGRIDVVLPFMLPNRDARRKVATVTAKLQNVKIDGSAADIIAEGSDRYSHADVAQLVRKARILARRRGENTIQDEDATLAVMYIRPPTLSQYGYFEKLALEAVSDGEYLPPEYLQRRNDTAAVSPIMKQSVSDKPARKQIGEL
ncbi:MAG: ATP-binding protein [Gammaproteobacteria bacterium]|nr:ATP-binding protein [Gammaproteobacteria bacterium]